MSLKLLEQNTPTRTFAARQEAVGSHFYRRQWYVNPRNDEFANRTTFSDRGAGDKNASKYGGNSNYERSWTVRPPALEDKLVDRLKDLLEVADRQQGIGEMATELVLKRQQWAALKRRYRF